jgi:hypothetical protein
MSASAPTNPSRPTAAAAAPAALAAFLRGVERRGAVLAELQCGDPDTADAALAAAMRLFRAEAAAMPMAEWPRRFWGLLLAQPGLRRHAPVAAELEVTDRLARLGSGPRAALLLRLAAGLEEPEAAAVLGVAPATYRLALQQALPRHEDGRADPVAWQRLREQVHRRIKTLPPVRLVRLGRAREAALGAAAPPQAGATPAPSRRPPRGLRPLLWALLALCGLALLATFAWPERFERGGSARSDGLPAAEPASRYGADAGLVSHRDFDLLADPQGMAAAEELAFHSWLAAQGASTPVPGAEPGPVRGDVVGAASPEPAPDGGAPAASSFGETFNEPR